MSRADAFAARLASEAMIDDPVAIVVAHPDDETLWAGAALSRLPNARLILLTDGAPVDMSDARRLGVATREAYAAIRAGELDKALRRLQATTERRDYAIADQGLADRLGDVAERLAVDLAEVVAVATHPYEGGHPDHDSAAFAVRLAVETIARRSGEAPAMVEFASYHQVDGQREFGVFWPDPDCPEHRRTLDDRDRDRVEQALRAHVSQASVFGDWRPTIERWRAAPRYDFTRSPPPGESLYDGFGWAMTSLEWRDRARAALAGAAAWT